MKIPKVREAIDLGIYALLDDPELLKKTCLKEMTNIALADFGNYADYKDGEFQFVDFDNLPPNATKVIQFGKTKWSKEGKSSEMKLYSKPDACKFLVEAIKGAEEAIGGPAIVGIGGLDTESL